MLYNLGKPKPNVNPLAALLVFCGLLACVGAVCVMLSVAVLIGNMIIGL